MLVGFLLTLLPNQTDQPMTLALQPAMMDLLNLLAMAMTTNCNQVSLHMQRKDSCDGSISDPYTKLFLFRSHLLQLKLLMILAWR